MFDSIEDPPKGRQSFSNRASARYVLFWLAVCICLTLYFWHLSNTDAVIAQRERIVAGRVIQVARGRGESVDYSFVYEGKSYRGHDGIRYPDLSVGENADVFIDPDAPTKNGLRSFSFKRDLNRNSMKFAIYGSIVLSMVSVIMWAQILTGNVP